MKRFTYNDLVAMAKDSLPNGKEYGNGIGQIRVIFTDARLAPYLYKMVEYSKNGGYKTIYGPATNREMRGFLAGWGQSQKTRS